MSRTTRSTVLALVAVGALIWSAMPAQAAAGDLDGSFSFDGKVVTVTDVGTYDDNLGSVALDPSTGKILQAGWTSNPNGATHDFAVVRYLAS